jgi:hypothetical protein
VRRPSDPLAGATRLLVDGTNLLHALAEGGARLPAAALIGRIRALVPPGVAVTIVLDGAPAPGAVDRRVASGVEVRHSGRRPADDVIRELAAADPEGVLVVTDDGALAGALRALGARTAGTAWIAGRFGRQHLEAPAAGRPRSPAPPPAGAGRGAPGVARPRGSGAGSAGPDEDPAPGWKPGRGSTRKRGNPRRGHPPG